MNLGPTELIIVLVIVLVLFGGAKLPKLAKSLGEAQRMLALHAIVEPRMHQQHGCAYLVSPAHSGTRFEDLSAIRRPVFEHFSEAEIVRFGRVRIVPAFHEFAAVVDSVKPVRCAGHCC